MRNEKRPRSKRTQSTQFNVGKPLTDANKISPTRNKIEAIKLVADMAIASPDEYVEILGKMYKSMHVSDPDRPCKKDINTTHGAGCGHVSRLHRDCWYFTWPIVFRYRDVVAKPDSLEAWSANKQREYQKKVVQYSRILA